MSSADDILISVESRHVEKMLAGEKMVELRRRKICLEYGTRVWIYSKMPLGKISALGFTKKVVEKKPTDIWNEYGSISGITIDEFHNYFHNANYATAIVFRCIVPLEPNLSLKDIKKKIAAFHPPQFFKRLTERSDERRYFHSLFSQSLQF